MLKISRKFLSIIQNIYTNCHFSASPMARMAPKHMSGNYYIMNSTEKIHICQCITRCFVLCFELCGIGCSRSNLDIGLACTGHFGPHTVSNVFARICLQTYTHVPIIMKIQMPLSISLIGSAAKDLVTSFRTGNGLGSYIWPNVTLGWPWFMRISGVLLDW